MDHQTGIAIQPFHFFVLQRIFYDLQILFQDRHIFLQLTNVLFQLLVIDAANFSTFFFIRQLSPSLTVYHHTMLCNNGEAKKKDLHSGKALSFLYMRIHRDMIIDQIFQQLDGNIYFFFCHFLNYFVIIQQDVLSHIITFAQI